MRARTTSSRFTVWLAILAMALNALWPLIANAKPAGVESLFEVCTTQGLKSVAGDPAGAPDDSGAKHLQPHCPLCSFGTDKMSAPPSSPLVIEPAAVAGRVALSAMVTESPSSDFRTPAHPRAPPFSS
jgi:hypothetical protein